MRGIPAGVGDIRVTTTYSHSHKVSSTPFLKPMRNKHDMDRHLSLYFDWLNGVCAGVEAFDDDIVHYKTKCTETRFIRAGIGS